MTVRDGARRWWAAGIGLGAFLNGLGLAVAVRTAVWTRQAATSPLPAGGRVTNRIGGGRFAGTVVQGRDIHTAPASSSRDRSITSGGIDGG